MILEVGNNPFDSDPKPKILCPAVRAAYNKAQRLPERRQMMQAWADYLDGLREGTNWVDCHAGRATTP